MKKKKGRKPRSINAHGNKNFDLCSCGYPYCDSMAANHEGVANQKIHKRMENDECMGCGKKGNKCSCKSSKSVKRPSKLTPLQQRLIKEAEKKYFKKLREQVKERYEQQI